MVRYMQAYVAISSAVFAALGDGCEVRFSCAPLALDLAPVFWTKVTSLVEDPFSVFQSRRSGFGVEAELPSVDTFVVIFKRFGVCGCDDWVIVESGVVI
jgi:hypothetical protein